MLRLSNWLLANLFLANPFYPYQPTGFYSNDLLLPA